MAKPRNTVPFLGDSRHRLVLVAALVLVLLTFAPTLIELVVKWGARPEYSHGFLMPFVAGWLIWERRAEFGSLEPSVSLFGVAVLAVGLATVVLGEVAVFEVVKPYAFVVALVGVLWALYGWTAVRLAAPATVALFLMCPLPRTLVTRITNPLKGSAAVVATGLLDLTGIEATLDGSQIHLPGLETLFVADACSGVNSLISLLSLAILVAMMWRRHWLVRLTVVVSCVPIAILANGIRIWLTGLLSVRVGRETAEGFFHFFQGLALFAVALAMLAAWAGLLSRAFRARTAVSP